MVRKYKIQSLLLILGLLVFSALPVFAQDIFKIDIGKTGGKFSDWVQKQRENYESVLEQISESQFATVIGDGIKSAKEGIQYAKETYNAALEKYEEVKNAVLDSPEYRMALVSQKIAEESLKLESLHQEQKTTIENLNISANAEIEATRAKIKQAENNFSIMAAAYEQELAKASAEDRPKVEQKIADFQSGSSAELKALEAKVPEILAQMMSEVEVVNEDFTKRIEDQTIKINQLRQQLNGLVSDTFGQNDDTITSASPEQSIASTMEELSIRKGAKLSLKDIKELEKRRFLKSNSVISQSAANAAEVITSTIDTDNEQQNSAAISETVNGKSEAVQIAIKGMITQIETLQKYLILELLALEEETVKIMVNSDIETSDPKVIIDICDYIEEEADDTAAEAATTNEPASSDTDDTSQEGGSIADFIGGIF